MINRRQKRILIFISSSLLFCALTVAIAFSLNNKAANSLLQYNWAKSQTRITTWLGDESDIHLVSNSASGELINFREGDRYRYGYINDDRQIIVDLQGNETTEAKYDRLDSVLLKRKYVLATQDGKQGILDWQGKTVIPFEYDRINYAEDIDLGYVIATKNGKQGVIDLENKIVVPFEYITIRTDIITKGLAIAFKNLKQGVINLQGDVLVSFEYDRLDDNITDLGYAIAQKDNKTGIVDLNDKAVIPFKYESIDRKIIKDGYGIARKNGKEGILGIDNKTIIPFKFSTIDPSIIHQKYGILTQGKYQGVMDIYGNTLLPFIYDRVNEVVRQTEDFRYSYNPHYNPQDYAYIVTKNNRQGVIDAEGKAIVPIRYDRIESSNPNQKSYIVTRNNRQGIIDFDGNTVIPLVEGRIESFYSGGYGIVTRNNKQRVIDLQGNAIVPFEYDRVNLVNLDRGYIIATKNGLQGAIDFQGKTLLPFKYNSISAGINARLYQSQLLLLNKDNSTSLFNLESRSTILTKLESIDSLYLPDANYAIATKNGKQGVINVDGKIHIPFEYDLAVPFYRNYLSVFTAENGKRGVFYYDDTYYDNVIIPAQYDRIDYLNSQEYYGIATKDGQTGIYDPKFDRFTPFNYDEVELLSADEYYLAVNKEGADITQIKDDTVSLLKERKKTRLLLKDFYSTDFKYALVYKNNKQGILTVADGKTVVPIEYDEIVSNANTLDYALAIKQGHAGILNLKNNTFVVVKGDNLDDSLLHRGYVIFSNQEKEGIADLTGKTIIPAEFDLISDSELKTANFKLLNNTYLIAKKDDKSGLLNLKTKKFVALDYDKIYYPRHDLISDPNLLFVSQDKRTGIIDLQGNLIVPLQNKPIYSYQNGVVLYGGGFDFDGQLYLLEPDETANITGKDKDLFINNSAILSTEGKYSNHGCAVNRQGELLLKSRHHNWGAREQIDNLCRSLVGIEVDNTVIKENPIPTELGSYDYYFSDGLRRVNVNNKWGFVNKKGDFVIYPQFDEVSPFNEDLAAVKINDKYGYTNKSGEIAIAPQFDKAWSFSGGFAVVIQDGKKNFIDTTGKIILNAEKYPQVSEEEAFNLY